MGVDDDFVMTIGDDDSVPLLDEDEQVAPALQKKTKTSRKANGKNAIAEGLDPNFTFDIGGGGVPGVANAWDFKAARQMLKSRDASRVSLDDIIAKKRRGLKSPQNDSAKKMKRQKEEEEEENDDDDEKMEDAFHEADSDNEDVLKDGEHADVRFDEDDEDIAADGFGGGALESDEDDEDEEEDDEEIEYEEEGDEDEDEEEEQEDEGEDEESNEEKEEDEIERERKKAYFAPSADHPHIVHDSFSSMNLSRPILKGLSQLGFVQPTAIQSVTIPVALLGKDICGGAVTGSGKTAAFVVPVLERLLYRPRQVPATRVVIMCPTRELAIQVHSVAVKLATFTDVQFCLCVGGLSVKVQEAELRLRPDVVIATPGRLIDHIRNSVSFTMDAVEILVMDEADRMLEDGFADELGEIVKACPKSRQTMLFSATMTDNVDQLIRMSLQRPVRLMIDAAGVAVARLTQEFVRIRAHRESDRSAVLIALCAKTFRRRVIVFFRSKVAVHQMRVVFGLLGLRAAELHGNLSQEQRLEALEKFRDGECDFLLATDLASRGLDIKGIETVINFNMPQNFAQYLHRVGRTARAGRNGRSVTLVGEADRKLLKLAVKSSQREKIKHRVVPPELVTKYREKLDGLKEQTKEVMDEEKEDKALRAAEMEMRKSENMLTHGDEIYSRPARTWFQSDRERKEAKGLGKEQHNSQFATEEDNKRKRETEKLKRDKFSGLNRTKRRRLEALQEEDAQARLSRQKAVRSAKRAALPAKITFERSAPKVAPVQKKKKKKDVTGFKMDLADVSKMNAGLAGKVNREADRAERKREKGKSVGKGKGRKVGGKGTGGKVKVKGKGTGGKIKVKGKGAGGKGKARVGKRR